MHSNKTAIPTMIADSSDDNPARKSRGTSLDAVG